MFLQKEQRDIIHRDSLEEVTDIIINIVDQYDSVGSTLLFDIDFAAILKTRVYVWEPTMEMRLPSCTSTADLTTVIYQSTVVMPHRSLAGLGPNYQAQLDAPMSVPFPELKQARQPTIVKYERQLAVDERYHSTLYKK